MNDHGYAIDLYVGELARQGRTEATRLRYTEVLYQFAEYMDRLGRAPWETTTNDCRLFLDTLTRPRPPRRYQHGSRPPASPSTLALYVSILRSYFAFLKDEQVVEANPMDPIKRPPCRRQEDLDVVTTSGGDVARMFAACTEWDELLALATVCYLGPRRKAAAQLRRKDRAKAMEQVRDLTRSALRPSAGMPPAGFEPALRP